MTEEEFNRLFGDSEPEQSPASVAHQQNAAPNAQPQQQQEAGGIEFDPEATAELLGSLVSQAEDDSEQAGTEQTSSLSPEQIQQARSSGILGKINDAISPPAALDAFTSGGMRAVFETKDFLFGDTPPEEQSTVRHAIEQQNDQLKEEAPIVNGLSARRPGAFNLAQGLRARIVCLFGFSFESGS